MAKRINKRQRIRNSKSKKDSEPAADVRVLLKQGLKVRREVLASFRPILGVGPRELTLRLR